MYLRNNTASSLDCTGKPRTSGLTHSRLHVVSQNIRVHYTMRRIALHSWSSRLRPVFQYCHVYEWLQTRGWLVIWFIDRLQIVTTSNYSAIANSHTLQFTIARTNLLSLLCLHQLLPGRGFQRRTFPLLRVPDLSSYLSYHLVTATTHNDWTAAVL
jgi:hypothetical protein